MAPISAPRIGPDARSQVDRRAGVQELAALEAERLGRGDARRPAGPRPRASPRAPGRWRRVRRGSARTAASASSGRRSAAARRRGRVGTACCSTASANISAPAVTTSGGVVSGERVVHRCASGREQVEGGARGGRVGQVHRGTGVGEHRRLPAQPLRVVAGPDQAHHAPGRPAATAVRTGPGRARRPGRGAHRRPSTTSRSSTPQVGVGSTSASSRSTRRRAVDHRVRAALGEPVVAEVDEGVATGRQVVAQRATRGAAGCWRRPPRPARWRSASPRRRACRRRTARAARRPRRPAVTAPGQCSGAAPGGPGRLDDGRRGGGQVGLAGAEQARARTGVDSERGVRPDGVGHLGGGRLGDHDDQRRSPGRRRAGRARAGWSGRRRRRTGRGRRRRGSARPRRRRRRGAPSGCWAPVPDAATMPTGPGRTTLAKPSPTPPTTAVPQSGPMTSSPRSGGAPLERDLLLDRHVVAEHHRRPGRRRAPSSASAKA